MNIGKIKVRKLLLILVIILLLSFISGVLFISILDEQNKELITSSINNYFNSINKNRINYLKGFLTDFSGNLFFNLFVWLMGISIVGVIVVILALMFKGFLVGFSFCSILYTYGFKGLVVGMVYIIPQIISLFIFFIVSYYAVDFSLLLFKNLFRKKDYNKKVIMYRYLKLLMVSSCFVLLNTLINVFLVPNILLLF